MLESYTGGEPEAETRQEFDVDGAREPMVTANDFLTIAKKFIDPGG